MNQTLALVAEVASSTWVTLAKYRYEPNSDASYRVRELREMTMVIFGSPVAGTPVMLAVPLAALDLPLKIVVWADGNQTKVSYDAPAAIARRRGLSPELAKNLADIGGLTDALVAP